MLSKKDVLKTVSKLPDNFSLDEIIDKLLFMEKVNKGLEDSMTDRVYTKDEAKSKLSKWLK